jgi:hypothetical protein
LDDLAICGAIVRFAEPERRGEPSVGPFPATRHRQRKPEFDDLTIARTGHFERATGDSTRRSVRSEPFRSHDDRTAGADSTARPRIAAEASPPHVDGGAIVRFAEPDRRGEPPVDGRAVSVRRQRGGEPDVDRGLALGVGVFVLNAGSAGYGCCFGFMMT